MRALPVLAQRPRPSERAQPRKSPSASTATSEPHPSAVRCRR